MDRFQHIDAIMRKESPHSGFWHGNPHHESAKKIFDYFGVKDDFELGNKLGSSFYWAGDARARYRHPDGDGWWDLYKGGKSKHLSEADDGDIDYINSLNWPDPQYIDFSGFDSLAQRARETKTPIVSGFWAPFYHNLADFFGMENYFVKMHTDPEAVTAATEKVVDFYIAANEKLMEKHSGDMVAYFFGNDFGTQLDLMISPELMMKFIVPYQKKISDQAKKYGLYSFLHSCGSIFKIIPQLIESGIQGIHPIQALAANMDAENLAGHFKDKVVFIGGVDTQVLLREGSPKRIKEEVRRLRGIFGANYFVSPSHEAILPDVPVENIAAMAEAAAED